MFEIQAVLLRRQTLHQPQNSGKESAKAQIKSFRKITSQISEKDGEVTMLGTITGQFTATNWRNKWKN